MQKQYESQYKSKTLAPGIEIYENAIPDCEQLIDFALSLDGWQDALVGNNEKNKNIRNNKMLPLPYDLGGELNWYILAKILKSISFDYCMKWHCDYELMEPPQLLHYIKGEGFYDYHMDTGPFSLRSFSCVAYLNDVKEGGETHFKHFDLNVSPKAGSVIMFPANFPYEHTAKPPISNDKFAVVTWFKPWTGVPSMLNIPQGEHNE